MPNVICNQTKCRKLNCLDKVEHKWSKMCDCACESENGEAGTVCLPVPEPVVQPKAEELVGRSTVGWALSDMQPDLESLRLTPKEISTIQKSTELPEDRSIWKMLDFTERVATIVANAQLEAVRPLVEKLQAGNKELQTRLDATDKLMAAYKKGFWKGK